MKGHGLGPSKTVSQQSAPIAEREAFFTRIVGEHARFLYRVAASLLRHPQDAEDAVQEALLKLYRGESWRGIADERAFLARVVWRAALDRKAARVTPTEDGAEFRLVDTHDTPERVAETRDERGLLQAWIEELCPELREPLVLSALEGMNSREIGAVMDLPEGTVRTRLMRARAELRARWEKTVRHQTLHGGNTRNSAGNREAAGSTGKGNAPQDSMHEIRQGAAVS